MKSFRDVPLALAALLFVGCGAGSAAGPGPRPEVAPQVKFDLEYTLTYAPDHLTVDGIFTGEPDGSTVLALPTSWAGETELWKGIRDFEIVSPDTQVVADPKRSGIIDVRHYPSQRVRFHYEVWQSFEGPLVPHRFRPIVTPHWMHFVGYGLFVQPKWKTGRVVSVRLRWRRFPKKWHIADSWGYDERDQAISIPLGNLRHALYLAGEYRMSKLEVRRHPVWVAMAGSWPFRDREFVSMVGKIVSAERKFWKDDDFPHFLVALLPGGKRCCAFAGTALTNSFTTMISTDRWRTDEIAFLLAHEMFHAWNGGEIVPEKHQGRRLFWFSEGFTSYYTWVLNLRAKVIDLPMYVRQYNEDIASYWLSPVRDVPNARINTDFWRSLDIQRLPYFRGEILAHHWNAVMRSRSHNKHSLDDFMRAVRDSKLEVTPDILAGIAAPLLGSRPTADLKKLKRGELFEPGPDDLGPCVRLEKRPVGFFELGFDLAASDRAGKIRGVREGSAAWDAGLRNGQEVLGFNVRISKPFPRENVIILIRDEKGEHRVTYFPQGPTQPVPQYVVDTTALKQHPKKCLAFFKPT